MQDPVTHRLNHFLNFLQKQNLTFLFHYQPSSIDLNLCKWGVIIIALLATFRTFLITKFRQNAHSIPLLFEDEDYSDDEEDDEICSISSMSSDFENDHEEEEEIQENRRGEVFRVRGSSGNGDGGFLRCRSIGDLFSLSEIANSKSVVKLWDTIGFGLGFGFDDTDSYDDGNVVSVYGSDEEQNTSPAVMVSDEENASGNSGLRIWDSRLRRRTPAVIAEWGPGFGRGGGVQKLYVRDDGRYGLTVGDVWNVSSPLKHVTESRLDSWWPNSCMLKM